jgi:hypothetical protein
MANFAVIALTAGRGVAGDNPVPFFKMIHAFSNSHHLSAEFMSESGWDRFNNHRMPAFIRFNIGSACQRGADFYQQLPFPGLRNIYALKTDILRRVEKGGIHF